MKKYEEQQTYRYTADLIGYTEQGNKEYEVAEKENKLWNKANTQNSNYRKFSVTEENRFTKLRHILKKPLELKIKNRHISLRHPGKKNPTHLSGTENHTSIRILITI